MIKNKELFDNSDIFKKLWIWDIQAIKKKLLNCGFISVKKISNSMETTFDAIEILEITPLMLLESENDSFDCK